MLLIAIALLMCMAPARGAAEPGDYLYVVTRPMGATVYLDGRAQAASTPLLLRGIPAGTYRIRVEKDGWYSREAMVDLSEGRIAEFAMVPREPLVHIEGYGGGESDRDINASEAATIRFSSEALILRPGAQGIGVAPVYPKQRLLDGVKMSLPLFLALTGVLTAREIYAPRKSDLVIAPELVASAVMGGGLFVWNVRLESDRARFLRNHRVRETTWEALSLAARLRFEAAEEALAGGNFEVALSRFMQLIDDYPEDPIMPRALFEKGRILFISGNYRDSAESYRTVADRYPLPDLHDRARKALADCLFALGDSEGALAQLDLLTFNGSGLTREEALLYRDLF